MISNYFTWATLDSYCLSSWRYSFIQIWFFNIWSSFTFWIKICLICTFILKQNCFILRIFCIICIFLVGLNIIYVNLFCIVLGKFCFSFYFMNSSINRSLVFLKWSNRHLNDIVTRWEKKLLSGIIIKGGGDIIEIIHFLL